MKQFKTDKILIEFSKTELLRTIGACNDAVEYYEENSLIALAVRTREIATELFQIYKELPF